MCALPLPSFFQSDHLVISFGSPDSDYNTDCLPAQAGWWINCFLDQQLKISWDTTNLTVLNTFWFKVDFEELISSSKSQLISSITESILSTPIKSKQPMSPLISPVQLWATQQDFSWMPFKVTPAAEISYACCIVTLHLLQWFPVPWLLVSSLIQILSKWLIV